MAGDTLSVRVSGGQGRGGVEERRVAVGEHVAALQVGDRGGVDDPVAGASVAGGTLGSSVIAVPSRSSTPSASSWRRSSSRRAWS
jgi:hypothetical protein